MLLKPNAKINLGLNILNKRADGFHNLESIFLPVSWEDELQIETANNFQFSSSGLPIPGDQSSNLCVKAYQLLKQDFKIPAVKIHLHKLIPMGAGLGGGSSDAAFTLKGLNQLFDLGLSQSKLESYSAQLGSDCVFFIKNKAALVKGRGEVLEHSLSLKLSGYILLVKPDVFISTKEAYAGVSPQEQNQSLRELINLPKEEWKNVIKNDFETSLFPKYPELEKIKQQLYEMGAYYAAMSGSGSCLYGLFEEEPKEFEKLFNGNEIKKVKI
jgi:4-diphosphocytidyl-2-C-methyl-D-erythritol kinase